MREYFDRICEQATLQNAWGQVLKKNSCGGLDGIQPAESEQQLCKSLPRIAEDLRAGRYTPVPYKKGAMPKFNDANEWRKLCLPSVTDKIVQQAFVDVIGPIFEKQFLDCSYAYRKGKGPLRALQRVEHILRSYPASWVVTADIDNFFDTLDHQILLASLAATVNEPEILNLASLWLRAGIISGRGQWEDPEEGIAQGSVVSPLFSNIYLHALDRHTTAKGIPYLRYSDNLILFAKTRDDGYLAYEELQAFLQESLKLRFNQDPNPVKEIDSGFTFLGLYFRGDLRRISAVKEAKTFRKLNWLTDKSRQPNPEAFLRHLNRAIDTARRYYGFIQPVEQFEAFDRHLLKRLRFLLAHYSSQGLLPSKAELDQFISRISFYRSRSADEHKDLCRNLVAGVVGVAAGRTNPAGEQACPPAAAGAAQGSQKRRGTAQQNRFLRRIAGQTEIFITTPGVFVGKTGGRIILREQRKNVFEGHLHKISHISIGANGVSLSSDLVFECCQLKVPITFYDPRGNPVVTLQSPFHAMGDVSILQTRIYETPRALELVKKILSGKAKNQMNLIKFYRRHRKSGNGDFTARADKNLEEMQKLAAGLQAVEWHEVFAKSRDLLFSYEGRIAACYWDTMKMLVPPDLGFAKRQRLHPADLVNNMLNYGYGILYQRVWQAVLKAGLSPYISFLHAFQPNKPTLIYDLVEEYRQSFVDRPIFSLLTRGKKGADLRLSPDNGLLDKQTKDQVIRAVLDRLSTLAVFRGKRIKCQEIIEFQAKSLTSFIRGKGVYKPYVAGY